MQNSKYPDRFLTFKQVRELTSLSRSTVWRLEKEGKFPLRRQLGRKSVVWFESEILRWMKEQPIVEETSGVSK